MELRARVLLWKLVLLQSEFGCGGGVGGREPLVGLSPSPGLGGGASAGKGWVWGPQRELLTTRRPPGRGGGEASRQVPQNFPSLDAGDGPGREGGQGGGSSWAPWRPPTSLGRPSGLCFSVVRRGVGGGLRGARRVCSQAPELTPPPPHPCRAGLLTRHIPPSGWAPGHISGAGIWRVGWQMVGSLPTSSLLVLQTSALREGRGGSWVGRQPSEDPGGRACEAWPPGRCHSGYARAEAPQTSPRCQALVLLWPCCSDV